MAGLLGRVKNMIYGESYDEDEYEDEYEEEESMQEERTAMPRAASSNVASFDRYSSSAERYSSDRYAGGDRYSRRPINSKVVNINTKMEVVISSPSTLEEAGEVCEDLKAKKTTVVNLENVEYDVAQRISDFLSGASYALDGSIQLVSDRIFIIGPVNVDITGELKDELRASGIKLPTSVWK